MDRWPQPTQLLTTGAAAGGASSSSTLLCRCRCLGGGGRGEQGTDEDDDDPDGASRSDLLSPLPAGTAARGLRVFDLPITQPVEGRLLRQGTLLMLDGDERRMRPWTVMLFSNGFYVVPLQGAVAAFGGADSFAWTPFAEVRPIGGDSADEACPLGDRPAFALSFFRHGMGFVFAPPAGPDAEQERDRWMSAMAGALHGFASSLFQGGCHVAVQPVLQVPSTATRLLAGHLLRDDGGYAVSMPYCELHVPRRDSALFIMYDTEACEALDGSIVITPVTSIFDREDEDSPCFSVKDFHFCARTAGEKHLWFRALQNIKVKLLNCAPSPSRKELRHWRQAVLDCSARIASREAPGAAAPHIAAPGGAASTPTPHIRAPGGATGAAARVAAARSPTPPTPGSGDLAAGSPPAEAVGPGGVAQTLALARRGGVGGDEEPWGASKALHLARPGRSADFLAPEPRLPLRDPVSPLLGPGPPKRCGDGGRGGARSESPAPGRGPSRASRSPSRVPSEGFAWSGRPSADRSGIERSPRSPPQRLWRPSARVGTAAAGPCHDGGDTGDDEAGDGGGGGDAGCGVDVQPAAGRGGGAEGGEVVAQRLVAASFAFSGGLAAPIGDDLADAAEPCAPAPGGARDEGRGAASSDGEDDLGPDEGIAGCLPGSGVMQDRASSRQREVAWLRRGLPASVLSRPAPPRPSAPAGGSRLVLRWGAGAAGGAGVAAPSADDPIAPMALSGLSDLAL